ncbi:MAG TPA: hypothetical protein DIC50_06450 [Verrucomicrobia subdivision 3 bacterium]|jgi:hypothetical protein|nr:hypothetical protein [Limisphaerales bacterium]
MPGRFEGANFSVKEKDGASLARECAPGFDECLHSPICRVWRLLFSGLRSGLSNINPAARVCSAGFVKDQ